MLKLKLFWLILSLLLIIILTLFPYDFFIQETISLLSDDFLLQRMKRPANFQDSLLNILLFIPFGLGATSFFNQVFKIGKFTLAKLILGLSFSLSFSIEILQIFIPTRNPTFMDISMNTLGGFSGFFIYQILAKYWEKLAKIIVKVYHQNISIPILIFGLISYLILLTFFQVNILPEIESWHLSNWNLDYNLVLGNEATGDRPWEGYISHLCIADQTISTREIQQVLTNQNCQVMGEHLIVDYDLTKSLPEQPDNLPKLLWKKASINQEEKDGIKLHKNNWLYSEKPVTFLNQKIRDSSQFTLFINYATSNLNQEGPARIISISQDPYQRNLTIGQWDHNLSIRIRNSVTKENGTRPEFSVPNIFQDPNYHNLLITYDSDHLSVYLDQIDNQHTLNFSPQTRLFWNLSPPFSSMIHVSPSLPKFYALIYAIIIISPLGIFSYLIIR